MTEFKVNCCHKKTKKNNSGRRSWGSPLKIISFFVFLKQFRKFEQKVSKMRNCHKKTNPVCQKCETVTKKQKKQFWKEKLRVTFENNCFFCFFWDSFVNLNKKCQKCETVTNKPKTTIIFKGDPKLLFPELFFLFFCDSSHFGQTGFFFFGTVS